MTTELKTWERAMEKMFDRAKSYNSTVISVGYATFFGCLVFLSNKVESSLVYWALLLVIGSALIFVMYEIAFNIKMARHFAKSGEVGEKHYRLWPVFFVPSLLLGFAGLGLLVWLVVGQFRPVDQAGQLGLSPGDRIKIGFVGSTGGSAEFQVLSTADSWIAVKRTWFIDNPKDGRVYSRGELARSETISIPISSIRAVSFVED